MVDARSLLNRLVAEDAIVDVAIKLGRHPITVERWRDGIDEIPNGVADWLEALEAAGLIGSVSE